MRQVLGRQGGVEPFASDTGSLLMRIDLTCSICGSNNFDLSDAEADTSIVTCIDCRHPCGTLGSLKEEMLRRLMQGTPSKTLRSDGSSTRILIEPDLPAH